MRLNDDIFYKALRGEIPQTKTDTDPLLPDVADVATTDYSRDLKAIQLMHDLAHRLTRACEYYAKKWDLELTDAWTGPEPEGVPEKQLVRIIAAAQSSARKAVAGELPTVDELRDIRDSHSPEARELMARYEGKAEAYRRNPDENPQYRPYFLLLQKAGLV